MLYVGDESRDSASETTAALCVNELEFKLKKQTNQPRNLAEAYYLSSGPRLKAVSVSWINSSELVVATGVLC